MAEKRIKRPRDLIERAKLIGDIATGQIEDVAETGSDNTEKDPAAVALGRRGGLRGGKARASKLTAKQRSESARKAARARWQKKSD